MKSYSLEGVQNFDDLYSREYEQSQWVKPGFRMGTVGALVAAGGSSKTMYSLQMGMDIACGNLFTKGGVLYLPAEDPIEEIGERVKHICDVMEYTPEAREDLKRNFLVWPLLGESPNLEDIEDGEKRPLVDAICEAAKLTGDPLRLVVFDTLRRFTYSDENDSGAMSRLLSCMEIVCRRTGASCYFLHHASKGAVLNGKVQEQQAARGSSVLSDNIRYQEFLAIMDENVAEKYGESENGRPPKVAIGWERRSYVLWGISKQNYGEPVQSQWFKRGDGGVLSPVEIALVEKNRKKNGGEW